MQLKVQKQYLKDVADFLYNVIELGGVKSVERMRIVKDLNKQHEEYSSEEMELLKQYAELDDQGNPVQYDDGTFWVKNAGVFREQQKKLHEDVYTIDDLNLQSALETVKDAVLNCDKNLKGKDAFIHYYLYEQFKDENEESAEA